MTSPAITAQEIDLSNCDREAVQFCQAIQPHGFLIAVEEESWTVRHVSVNSASLFGRPAESLIGMPLADLLGDDIDTSVREGTQGRPLSHGPHHIRQVTLGPTGADLHLFAHRHDGLLILELEPASGRSSHALISLYDDVRLCIQELQDTRSFQDFLDLAVRRIRSFARFDRVVLYKFLEDASGEVLAEARREEMESYLGKRFPASDIPVPARRLYELVWLKYMPDITYEPVPIVPQLHATTQTPIDLTYAFLRSQSPMCNKYYLNMGVRGKLVLSLMKEGKLWGTVTCHYEQPTSVPYEVRMAAECLAHMTSLLLAAKEDAEQYGYRLKLAATVEQLANNLQQSDPLTALTGRQTSMATCMEADGAAAVIGKAVVLVGGTPTEEEVRDLSRWLAGQSNDVLETHRLPSLYPPASAFRHHPCGLLAARLSRDGTDALFWFRREVLQTVKWAGDPRKPVEVNPDNGEQRLTPRRSFEVWQETVRGTAKPWLTVEREFVKSLRECTMAAQLVQANRELARQNQDLESFAHVAAHDLREPLRGIRYMTGFLSETAQDKLTPEERQQVVTIANMVERMDQLISGLLRWSQVGYEERHPEVYAVGPLAQQAVAMLHILIKESGAKVSIQDNMPSCRCDAVGVIEIFQNLIANAVKYNDKPEKRIEIGHEPAVRPTFFVRDNGIGIKPQHHQRVFTVFKRLHRRNEYGGGTGAGLSIVKRIVERHGGTVWLESEPGEGSTFFFTLGASNEQIKHGEMTQ